MNSQKMFIWLSIAAGLLMALVSLLGITSPGTYGKETPNWAAQALGQDWINLAVVFPMLLISALVVLRQKSVRGLLIWFGALIYLIYSYTLYSFFVHFGPLFLLYVAILSLSFYSFVGGLVSLDWQAMSKVLSGVATKPAGILLATIAVLFSLLWLADILGALARGGTPADLGKIGLWVNPVHVLDLSFLLPGAFIVAVLLRRKRTLGLVLAAPLLTFFVLMGLAIISMMIVTSQKGFALALPQVFVMGAIIVASSIIAIRYLGQVR